MLAQTPPAASPFPRLSALMERDWIHASRRAKRQQAIISTNPSLRGMFVLL
jgi:hypothetical protein